ncbi:glycosyltransferase 61 family protein [Synechococcus sp. A15-60]|uniref:glycosyltransferase 61 family protein n=1 Tax=Synechococcus sp. A15-60 TaxID=1050655 RepID=UPI001648C23F|nr:glycosyltransferase 61 family protein [Synechococcus sp. A15-60]QNI46837.1 galactosyl transferase GMA12/MNN10 family protein [Synechococcus sp. A15-60]
MRVLHLLAEDRVLFHLFALELKAVHDRLTLEPDQDWAALIPASFAGSWRHRALEGLLPVFTAADDLPPGHQPIPLGPAQLNPQLESNWLVPYRRFADCQPCPKARDMVTRIQRHHRVLPGPARECVLIQRRESRVLRVAETNECLEQWLAPRLAEVGIFLKVVVFEDLDPLDQWRAVGQARVLIGAHGSGLTNLVFTPVDCQVLEIDFRRLWNCDPLCEAHRSGRLASWESCSKHPPEYHKADYHNLCGLYGRSYCALSALDSTGYVGSNPIDVSALIVSGNSLLEQVKSCMVSATAFGRIRSLRPRIAVLSSFYGRPYWSRDSLANHLFYCLHHGYDYFPALQRSSPELHHSWERVARLRSQLLAGRYEALFWMDGDSWFLDSGFPLESFLEGSTASIQFTGDQSDVINTGHLLFRCDAAALSFLDAWWAMRGPTDARLATSHYWSGGLMDGPAAIALLGGADPLKSDTWATGFNNINGCPGNPYRRLKKFQATHCPVDVERASCAESEIAEPWRSKCKVWPQGRLNAYPWQIQEGDFIVHFVGDEAKTWMKASRHLVNRYPS